MYLHPLPQPDALPICQRCVEAIDERRKLAQSGLSNAGVQLQPERRYPSPQWQQQPLEGMRLLQRRSQIAGLADIAGKFGTEAEALGHLAGPALDLLLRWPGVQRGIALDCIEGGTVGGKEIGSRRSRRVQRDRKSTRLNSSH